MLLHGATAEAVDTTRTADHLGDDPVASFVATAAELHAAMREPGAMARTTQHRLASAPAPSCSTCACSTSPCTLGTSWPGSWPRDVLAALRLRLRRRCRSPRRFRPRRRHQPPHPVPRVRHRRLPLDTAHSTVACPTAEPSSDPQAERHHAEARQQLPPRPRHYRAVDPNQLWFTHRAVANNRRRLLVPRLHQNVIAGSSPDRPRDRCHIESGSAEPHNPMSHATHTPMPRARGRKAAAGRGKRRTVALLLRGGRDRSGRRRRVVEQEHGH